MPKECLELRTKLQIEYYRLLDWSEVAGLIEYEYGQDLPDILKADKLVLVAVLTQIKALFEDFAALNGRYKELQPTETAAQKLEARTTNVQLEFASIELKYEKNAEKRRHLRGTNHMLAMVKNVKNIATEPKRLWWAAFDVVVFKELLQKLAEYNDYLSALMHGHHARKLEEMVRNTYLEMVLVRSTVKELKHLMSAALILGERQPQILSEDVDQVQAAHQKNDELLRSLAGFKTLSVATDKGGNDRPPDYEEITRSTMKAYTSIWYDEEQTQTSTYVAKSSMRADGKFSPGQGQQIQVWIEWKPYRSAYKRGTHQLVPISAHTKRIRELAALLEMDKPEQFHVPKCRGYFDDRDDALESEHEERFGLIFEKPFQNAESASPISLLQAFASECPSLTERVTVANKIATSILYLHAVKWLHKGICADSIVFFPRDDSHEPDRPTNYMKPYLCGFEYARPDRDGATTTSGRTSQSHEMYRHPSYQGAKALGNYRKTFDVYSLGIVLFEIAFWEPIQSILEIEDPETATSEELAAIRDRLLNPGDKYLGGLRATMGGRYCKAAQICVRGREALGISEEDNEADVIIAARLQKAFTENVLGNLAAIVT